MLKYQSMILKYINIQSMSQQLTERKKEYQSHPGFDTTNQRQSLQPTNKLMYYTYEQFKVIISKSVKLYPLIDNFLEKFSQQNLDFRMNHISEQDFQCKFPLYHTKDKNLLSARLTYFALEYTKQQDDITEKKLRQHQKRRQSSQEDQKNKCIPSFITIRKKCHQMLEAQQSNEKFKDQLQEVKKLITDQLKADQGLIDEYLIFIRSYFEYKVIKTSEAKEALLQKRNPNQKAKQNNKKRISSKERSKIKEEQKLQYWYISEQRSQNLEEIKELSQQIKRWREIYNLVPSLVSQKIAQIQTQHEGKSFVVICRDKLIKALENIYLVESPIKQNYAASLTDIHNINNIIIFTNNRQETLTFQEYKDGPFRSYLYLCILHQLSHVLLRLFPQSKIGHLCRSFDKKEDNDQIVQLKTLVERFSIIPEYFQLKKIRWFTLEFKREQSDNLVDELKQVKTNFSSLSGEMNKLNPQLYSIKDYYLSKSGVLNLVQKIHFERFSEDERKQLYNYIDELVKKPKEEPVQQAIQGQQYKYQTFFSLLLTKDIASKLLKPTSKSQIQKCNKTIKKLNDFKGKKYFNGQSTPIDKICNSMPLIKIVKQKMKTFQHYNKLILIQKRSDEKWESIVKSIIIKAENILVQERLETLNQNYASWKYLIQKFFFNEFDSKKFKKLKQKDNLFFLADSEITNDSRIKLQRLMKKKLESLLLLQYHLQITRQFFRNLELYTQISVMIQYLIIFCQKIQPQSGQMLEDNVFPNLDQLIYKKDYNLLKQFSESSRKQVGISPIDESERRLSVTIGRQTLNNEPFVRRSRFCKMAYLDPEQVIYSLLKKQLQQQKEKSGQKYSSRQSDVIQQPGDMQEANEQNMDKMREEAPREDQVISVMPPCLIEENQSGRIMERQVIKQEPSKNTRRNNFTTEYGGPNKKIKF